MRCKSVSKKSYPKNRKSSLRGRMESISIAKTGTRWYKNILSGETRPFIPGSEPVGWIQGMIKNTPNNNTPDVREKLSDAQKKYRSEESLEKRNERLRKYHATIQDRKDRLNKEDGMF